jgi:hypothetical protein
MLALVFGAQAFACSHSEDAALDGGVDDAGDAIDSSVQFGGATFDPFDTDAGLAFRVTFVLGGCLGAPESFCHGEGASGFRARLTGPGADIVNVLSVERPDLDRVTPGDLEASYLYLKLLGDGGIVGGRMPLDTAYDPRVPILFAEWIEAGAPTTE